MADIDEFRRKAVPLHGAWMRTWLLRQLRSADYSKVYLVEIAKLSRFANTFEGPLGSIDSLIHSRQGEPADAPAWTQRGGGSPGGSGRAPEALTDPPSSVSFLSSCSQGPERQRSVPEPSRSATPCPPRGRRHHTACGEQPKCVEGEHACPRPGVPASHLGAPAKRRSPSHTNRSSDPSSTTPLGLRSQL